MSFVVVVVVVVVVVLQRLRHTGGSHVTSVDPELFAISETQSVSGGACHCAEQDEKVKWRQLSCRVTGRFYRHG